MEGMENLDMPTPVAFRIQLTYIADGMIRPLSVTRVVGAYSVTEALRDVTRLYSTAYRGGFTVLSWTAENLDKPVELKYVKNG